jgi:5-methylcytosine-specific restriction endonuclease McrA
MRPSEARRRAAAGRKRLAESLEDAQELSLEGRVVPLHEGGSTSRRTKHAKSIRPNAWLYDDYEMSLRAFVRGACRRARRAGHQTDIRSVRALDEHLKRFGYRCYWCGADFEELDHVEALALGGRDVLANLVPACCQCNSRKGEMPIDEWLTLIAAALPVPSGGGS